jgi:Nucleolar complex-associated protein
MAASKLKFLASIDEKDLTLFAKHAVQPVKSKREKKAEKKALVKQKKAAAAATGDIVHDDDDDDESMEQPAPPIGKQRGSAGNNSNSSSSSGTGSKRDVEYIPRTAYTRGWETALDAREALPVIENGKVIRSKRVEEDIAGRFADEMDESDGDDDNDVGDEDDTANGGKGGPSERVEPESEFDFAADFDAVESIDAVSASAATTLPDAAGKTKKSGNSGTKVKLLPARAMKARIAEICSDITADPERSLKKNREDVEGNSTFGMSDLLDLLFVEDGTIAELAMLSALIVFKDIVPGYRIRRQTDAEQGAQLKKETQRLRHFEHALLGAYQRYVSFIDSKVKLGLGNPKKTLKDIHSSDTRLGLSALRCQCELLRWLPHFNLRSLILQSVVTRAAQPTEEITSICCSTLQYLFQHDLEGEPTLDAIKLIAKLLAALKYEVPVGLLKSLQSVKLSVHADDAKGIRRKVKQEKRKRKRQADEVEAGMMEATAVADKSLVKRFQADSLHEICLIYFRYSTALHPNASHMC